MVSAAEQFPSRLALTSRFSSSSPASHSRPIYTQLEASPKTPIANITLVINFLLLSIEDSESLADLAPVLPPLSGSDAGSKSREIAFVGCADDNGSVAGVGSGAGADWVVLDDDDPAAGGGGGA